MTLRAESFKADAPGHVIRSTATPYYLQVADILRSGIEAGTWGPGQLIPSEASLGEMFGVSRTAIRQALGQLVAEGLLHKEKGRGTFVSRPHLALAVQELRGFFAEMAAAGRAVTTRILRQELAPVPPAVAPDLGVPMGSRVVVIERVRSVGAEPLVHATTYLPAGRFGALVDVDLSTRSLYAVLQESFGVAPYGGERRIEAAGAGTAYARLLAVRPRDPVLRVTATNVDQNGVPFEWFESHYRGDRTAFRAVVGVTSAPVPQVDTLEPA